MVTVIARRLILFTVSSMAFLLFNPHSLAAQRKPPKKVVKRVAKNAGPQWYFSLIGSHQVQSEREVETESDGTYQLSEFSGSAYFFSFGLQNPLTSKWSSMVGVSFRRTSLVGNASNSVGGSSNKFRLSGQYVGLEMGFRYRFSKNSPWTLIALLESGKEIRSELEVLSGPPLGNNSVEKVSNISFLGGLSYDYRFRKEWVFQPTLRYGAIVTADPSIMLYEGVISVLRAL